MKRKDEIPKKDSLGHRWMPRRGRQSILPNICVECGAISGTDDACKKCKP